MKIYFPDYEDYKPHWRNTTIEWEAKEDDHYKCVDDIKNYIILGSQNRANKKNGNEVITTENQKLKLLNDLEEDIRKSMLNNKYCSFVCKEFGHKKKDIECKLLQYPIGEIRDKWKQEADKLIKIEDNNRIQSNKFVKQNSEEIYKMISDRRDEILLLTKEKKKEENKRYRENIKILQGKEQRVLLTEEQKEENRKVAQEKYKQKNSKPPRVLLTEEQKEEHKKIAIQKFKEKNNKPTKVKLTEDEKKEKKKLANQKYREQVKQKEDVTQTNNF
jgi:hypothetical protein